MVYHMQLGEARYEIKTSVRDNNCSRACVGEPPRNPPGGDIIAGTRQWIGATDEWGCVHVDYTWVEVLQLRCSILLGLSNEGAGREEQ